MFSQCKLVLEWTSFGRAFAQNPQAAYLSDAISQLAQMVTVLHFVVPRAHPPRPRPTTASRSKNPGPFSMPFVERLSVSVPARGLGQARGAFDPLNAQRAILVHFSQ